MNKFDLKILDGRITEEMLRPSTPGSAGIDLVSVGNYIPDKRSLILIHPGRVELVRTGIAIHLNNPGYAAMILPRSGLGHKKGLILGNTIGLIDSDYQGELLISAWNRSSEAIFIREMDRIAQLIIVPVVRPEFNIVNDFNQSERGDGGFGSTGK